MSWCRSSERPAIREMVEQEGALRVGFEAQHATYAA